MIPHKSRKFRAILALSYTIKLMQCRIKAVNDTTTKIAPERARDKMGHMLGCIIYAYAEAEEEDIIFAGKMDGKDGFWRCVVAEGQEWNFAYVLPQKEGEPIRLVIPTSLQMGWIETPGYFCAASETGRNVAKSYAQSKIGSLPNNKFLDDAKGSPEPRI